jgi:hypothetical protein
MDSQIARARVVETHGIVTPAIELMIVCPGGRPHVAATSRARPGIAEVSRRDREFGGIAALYVFGAAAQ